MILNLEVQEWQRQSKRPIEVKARIRYLHQDAEAMVIPLDEDKVRVEFKQPQMEITPGQAVVFYDNNIVIGGGTIERTGR